MAKITKNTGDNLPVFYLCYLAISFRPFLSSFFYICFSLGGMKYETEKQRWKKEGKPRLSAEVNARRQEFRGGCSRGKIVVFWRALASAARRSLFSFCSLFSHAMLLKRKIKKRKERGRESKRTAQRNMKRPRQTNPALGLCFLTAWFVLYCLFLSFCSLALSRLRLLPPASFPSFLSFVWQRTLAWAASRQPKEKERRRKGEVRRIQKDK